MWQSYDFLRDGRFSEFNASKSETHAGLRQLPLAEDLPKKEVFFGG
jgi:hypothetical protein